MSELPKDLKYAKTHEWAKLEDDNLVRVGITDFAQAELGDLVYVDLPETGKTFQQGEQCAVVESVKTASDLHSPVTGTIVAINEELADEPELINEDAFNTWLFVVKADDTAELNQLLDKDAYQQIIED